MIGSAVLHNTTRSGRLIKRPLDSNVFDYEYAITSSSEEELTHTEEDDFSSDEYDSQPIETTWPKRIKSIKDGKFVSLVYRYVFPGNFLSSRRPPSSVKYATGGYFAFKYYDPFPMGLSNEKNGFKQNSDSFVALLPKPLHNQTNPFEVTDPTSEGADLQFTNLADTNFDYSEYWAEMDAEIFETNVEPSTIPLECERDVTNIIDDPFQKPILPTRLINKLNDPIPSHMPLGLTSVKWSSSLPSSPPPPLFGFHNSLAKDPMQLSPSNLMPISEQPTIHLTSEFDAFPL